MANIIDGKALSQKVKDELKIKVEKFLRKEFNSYFLDDYVSNDVNEVYEFFETNELLLALRVREDALLTIYLSWYFITPGTPELSSKIRISM